MIQKKNTPWGLLIGILLMSEIAAYYVGGLFSLEGVTFNNYQEKLLEIVRNPFQNWFNQMTMALMGVAVIVWLMAVSYFLTYYRNYYFDSEHGTAAWGDAKTIGKRLRKQKSDNEDVFDTYLSHNVSVSSKALSNMNMLIIGGSGSYKSTSIVTPNILAAHCTNVILDVKGDLLKKHGNYLKQKGIEVRSLNFINFDESDRYNPFAYIESDADMVSFITFLQQGVQRDDKHGGDPFWDDGVSLYLQAIFYYEWLEAREQKRMPTMNNILALANMETTMAPGKEDVTLLQEKMEALEEKYGVNYPPCRDYRKLKKGATETVRSIIIMVNAQYKLFELPEIARIFEGPNDIDIPSLGLGVGGNPKKKTALFLVMPDDDRTYNLFINIFYTQMFRVLRRIADNDCEGGSLPIHVRLWADEYYAGPKPADSEKLLGVIRSRNISIVPILQDIAQIKTLFPQDKWEIFTGNCAATVYLGSGPMAYSTFEWISNLLSKTTVDSRSESLGQGSHGSSSLQMSRTGISLMTSDAVAQKPKEDCILFIEQERPIYDKKNLPWKYKKENTAWEESERVRGKGYRNPVRVIYNKRQLRYRTVELQSRLTYLSAEDYKFYVDAAKSGEDIAIYNMEETEFLYMNFQKKKLTEEDACQAFKECMRRSDIREKKVPDDVFMVHVEEYPIDKAGKGEVSSTQPEDNWDLSGTASEWLVRYADQLTEDEKEEIVLGMEAGLSDEMIKVYFTLKDAKKMKRWREVLQRRNEKEEDKNHE